MPFPIELKFTTPHLFQGRAQSITLYSGLTQIVGPNGSGKSQILRHLKSVLPQYAGSRHVKYLSSARLAALDVYRAIDTRHRSEPYYEGVPQGIRLDLLEGGEYKIETAASAFYTLKNRPDLQVKIRERLRALFKRDIKFQWTAQGLNIDFNRIGEGTYSLSMEASGLLHVITILTSIFDEKIGVLLVDEPELSLHPQLQAFLLREMKAYSGDPSGTCKKIIVIATHSTSMISVRTVEDISNIIFTIDANESPRQISPDNDTLKNRKLKAFVSQIGAYKDVFFTSHPLLVEGPSDALIAEALEQKYNLYLGAAGSQVLPTLSKDSMPGAAKLMKLIGKCPVVMADLDGFTDSDNLVSIFSGDPQAEELVQRQGHESLIRYVHQVKDALANLIDNRWDEISSKAKEHSYWVDVNEENIEIRKKRSAVAVLLAMSEPEASSLLSCEWIGLRHRLIALLDILEAAGCFFLRRGTIENYYQNTPVDISRRADKIKYAEVEAVSIIESEQSVITQQYEDILKVLRFAARSPEIDEVAAIKELILSVVAPAMVRLATSNNHDLQNTVNRILGEDAGTIKLEKIGDDKKTILRVSLKSEILNIAGLPIDLPQDCDPVQFLNERLVSR
ncbi:AAA family ATPase [Leptolyngbya sp. FACHB-16]|uniref:ATP-dependent nuclease n=1 Tax=unclassified Leptolyngbya TaxID=2650499 RepID=UPI0016824641|nr:AAA family ATPase [Leptolyngbya sp. FACHB-16]MBD2153160.1 AAA family ATPase [Leptolyngbya sp. FACHB-16]